MSSYNLVTTSYQKWFWLLFIIIMILIINTILKAVLDYHGIKINGKNCVHV